MQGALDLCASFKAYAGYPKRPGRGSCVMDDFSVKVVFNMGEDIHIPEVREIIQQGESNEINVGATFLRN